MSVILKDIDAKKRMSNNYSEHNAKMYDMKEYIDIAKRCISIFAGSAMSSKMIKDEDAISHVAEHVMWGHIRWREDGGRTLKSYLNQCAIWAVKVWKTKIYKSEKNKIMSLNHQITNSEGSCVEQIDLLKDEKAKTPFEEAFLNTNEEAVSIINNTKLTNLQKTCVEERYLYNKKLQQIADSLGVSRQAVNQHIKKAINKLRKHHGICG